MIQEDSRILENADVPAIVAAHHLGVLDQMMGVENEGRVKQSPASRTVSLLEKIREAGSRGKEEQDKMCCVTTKRRGG